MTRIINTVIIESSLGMVEGGDGVAVELELAERVCIDAVEPPRSSVHHAPYFGHAVKLTLVFETARNFRLLLFF